MSKKIAIVYDWIDKWGGVERLLLALHDMYPDAVFFTSYYDKKNATWARDLQIKTSFLQKFPSFIKKNRLISVLFFPLAFESFDFSEFDTVISVSSAFAKGVITKPQTTHIAYILTPTRYFWGQRFEYFNSIFRRLGALLFGTDLRRWDFVAAQRPDKVIAISQVVANRVQKYYQRQATILYPPFDLEYWEKIQKQIQENAVLPSNQFYLMVSRLEPYKHVDIAVEAFRRMPGKTLIIVGTGSEELNLKKNAGPNTIFMGQVSDIKLAELYLHAEAMLMPQEEDFGYVALEAQFFGCPVISYQESGVRETVIENKTGLFFKEPTAMNLIKALERFEKISYNLKTATKRMGIKQVQKFAKDQFLQQFRGIIS